MIKIKIPLRTHFAISKNKVKADRFMKANGQILYNQSLSRFARKYMMENMHDFIAKYLEIEPIEDFPIEVQFKFHMIRNYQSVRRVKGEIRFPPNPNKEPSYDLDNVVSIWKKAFNDTLTICGKIPDDNVNYIRKSGEEVVFIEDPEKMFIEINITKYEESKQSSGRTIKKTGI